MLPFLLNSVLFILVGLQLPNVLAGISGEYPASSVLLYAALVGLTVLGTRFVWTFPATYLPRFLSRSLRERDPAPPWQHTAVIGYTGMRGAVSLAAALSIPLTVSGGEPFPGRDLILFLTFCVILVTLVPQGLSLPLIIRRLGLAGGEDEAGEEAEARLRAAEACLQKIEELEQEDWVHEGTARRIRDVYEYRRRRFAAWFDHDGQSGNGDDEDYEERSLAYQRFRRELLGAERDALLRLRDRGRLSDETRRRIEADLDLEDAQLEI